MGAWGAVGDVDTGAGGENDARAETGSGGVDEGDKSRGFCVLSIDGAKRAHTESGRGHGECGDEGVQDHCGADAVALLGDEDVKKAIIGKVGEGHVSKGRARERCCHGVEGKGCGVPFVEKDTDDEV